jgi:hypothetical protein
MKPDSIHRLDPNMEVHSPCQDFPTRFQLLDKIEAKNETIAVLIVVVTMSLLLNLIMLFLSR